MDNRAERLALSTLCDELADLRTECVQQPQCHQDLLTRVEAEARARRPILGLLAQLLGTDEGSATRALGAQLPGTGPGHADEESFGCPDGACDRVETTQPAGAIPQCLVTGTSMARRL